eukprot:m51a1_g4165 hypothetical protein (730) ;mRNA; f:288370-292454
MAAQSGPCVDFSAVTLAAVLLYSAALASSLWCLFHKRSTGWRTSLTVVYLLVVLLHSVRLVNFLVVLLDRCWGGTSFSSAAMRALRNTPYCMYFATVVLVSRYCVEWGVPVTLPTPARRVVITLLWVAKLSYLALNAAQSRTDPRQFHGTRMCFESLACLSLVLSFLIMGANGLHLFPDKILEPVPKYRCLCLGAMSVLSLLRLSVLGLRNRERIVSDSVRPMQKERKLVIDALWEWRQQHEELVRRLVTLSDRYHGGLSCGQRLWTALESRADLKDSLRRARLPALPRDVEDVLSHPWARKRVDGVPSDNAVQQQLGISKHDFLLLVLVLMYHSGRPASKRQSTDSVKHEEPEKKKRRRTSRRDSSESSSSQDEGDDEEEDSSDSDRSAKRRKGRWSGRGQIQEVEKILDARIRCGRWQYLVRWKGDSEDSWEYKGNCKGCPQAIKDFLDARKRQKKQQRERDRAAGRPHGKAADARRKRERERERGPSARAAQREDSDSDTEDEPEPMTVDGSPVLLLNGLSPRNVVVQQVSSPEPQSPAPAPAAAMCPTFVRPPVLAMINSPPAPPTFAVPAGVTAAAAAAASAAPASPAHASHGAPSSALTTPLAAHAAPAAYAGGELPHMNAAFRAAFSPAPSAMPASPLSSPASNTIPSPMAAAMMHPSIASLMMSREAVAQRDKMLAQKGADTLALRLSLLQHHAAALAQGLVSLAADIEELKNRQQKSNSN